MRVNLIDIDLKYRSHLARGKIFPNLALMKLSRYFKCRGHTVGLNLESPDRTFISCVFTKNRLHAITEYLSTPGEVWIGGSGISNQFLLSPPIEYSMPDYDLYPSEYSMGFTTRGCIRSCPFCIVRKKEGSFRRELHISEFHDTRFSLCKLLDNNALADTEWFFDNTNWAIDNGVYLDYTQGLDIRLLTEEIAAQLKKIKFRDSQIHFAWDDVRMEDDVIRGIELLKDAGINTKRNVTFYILTGYGEDPFCNALYRCNRLKELGANPYIMPYDDGTGIPDLTKALARWANRKQLFKQIPFYKYDRL